MSRFKFKISKNNRRHKNNRHHKNNNYMKKWVPVHNVKNYTERSNTQLIFYINLNYNLE